MRFWINALATSWAYFLKLFPTSWLWFFAKVLAWIWFDVLKLRRWTVLKNLTIAFPDKSKADRMKLAKLSMQHMCFGIFEFGLMPVMDQKWLETRAVFHGLENYEKAHKQGQGLLLLSLHMGNGDVGVAAMALKGLRFNLISKKFKNQMINELWFGVREKMGTRFLEPHGRNTAFDILKATKRNEGVIFVIDQFMGRPYGIETTFFGKKTGSAYGLALFAMKTGAPVLPVYAYRDDQLKTHIVFEKPVGFDTLESEKSDDSGTNKQDKDLQIHRMTQKYNDRVEAIVRAHPEQWMWVHRRWKLWE